MHIIFGFFPVHSCLNMPFEECLQVYDLIRSSKSIEYSWFRKKDFIQHTGIIISFDSLQTMLLEFGAVLSHPKTMLKYIAISTANASLKISKMISPPPKYNSKQQKFKNFVATTQLKGKISLIQFCPDNLEVMGRLIKLSLERKEEKENAINMFNCIAQIDVGEYQLMENNCRNYVITVATYLREYPEFRGEDWSKFEYKMQELLSEDHYNFHNLAEYALQYISKISKSSSQSLEDESIKLSQQIEKRY